MTTEGDLQWLPDVKVLGYGHTALLTVQFTPDHWARLFIPDPMSTHQGAYSLAAHWHTELIN